MIKQQIAYQLALNKLAGKPYTHYDDLGVTPEVANLLKKEGIISSNGEWYCITPTAEKWLQSKFPHDKMINPQEG
jgi:hypothetical protein